MFRNRIHIKSSQCKCFRLTAYIYMCVYMCVCVTIINYVCTVSQYNSSLNSNSVFLHHPHSPQVHFTFKINSFKQLYVMSLQSNCYSAILKNWQSIKEIRNTVYIGPNETRKNELKLPKLLQQVIRLWKILKKMICADVIIKKAYLQETMPNQCI